MQDYTQSPPEDHVQVDLSISGKTYVLRAPKNDVAMLENAERKINEFIQTARKNSPNLTQEALLVLCALDLYQQSYKAQERTQMLGAQEERARALIDKILKDAQSIANSTPSTSS